MDYAGHILSAIEKLGFPIVMCLLLYWTTFKILKELLKITRRLVGIVTLIAAKLDVNADLIDKESE